MSTNLQSPTKLTEFAPLQVEEKPQTVGQYISKFFNLGKTAEKPNEGETEVNGEKLPNWVVDSALEAKHVDPDNAQNVYPVDFNEGRSLPNVLKRISNLIALKTTSLQNYGETELKQYWMPDSVSKECYECCERFTTFKRRHHCRVCGQIFCSQCCNQQIPGKIIGCTGDLRVCTYCCKVVLSYLQSSDVGADLTADLRILQENLQTKFGDSLSPISRQESVTKNSNLNPNEGVSIKRKISVGYQEEKFASESSVSYITAEEKIRALQNSTSLRNLYEDICKSNTGVPLKTHRYRLRNYYNCFLGSELVDWLIFQQKAKTRIQASTISQALLEGGYIECISEHCTFLDGYALYKYGNLLSLNVLDKINNLIAPFQDEPIWVQQIPHESSTTDSENEHVSPGHRVSKLTASSSFMLDLNVGANTVYLSCPLEESPLETNPPDLTTSVSESSKETIEVRPEQREMVPESGWHNTPTLREENGEKYAYNLLTETYELHKQNLLKQLLVSMGVSLSWCEVILTLLPDIVNNIRPDKNHDAIDLDIRLYIQFKKLPGGARSDTILLRGIVFTKNVAHREMSTEIENPKILLLQCAIVYQRNEGRLMSLEPVLMQEHEYLRHVVARIAALQPDIVLVQRNVSRLAQDLLRQCKIVLVHNVKQTVMERLSRCTDADLVTAVDAHIGRPRLGTCKKFYVKKFEVENGPPKTLMFFDGLPLPHLGGTVLLRGASRSVLSRLEKVASFMLFTAYNWRLEKSFLMDEFAQPPNTKCEFLDDSKENSPKLPDAKPIALDVKLSESTPVKGEKIEHEGKKILSEEIKDFTDPLHSTYDNSESQKTTEQFSVAELPFSNNFRKALDDTILCISPYTLFPIPYLETEVGKKCSLRRFFPTEIYFSEQFNDNNDRKSKWKEETEVVSKNISTAEKKKPLHPFLTAKITTSVEDTNVQNLLANFRACGGNYKKREFIKEKPNKTESKGVLKVIDIDRLDVLSPLNHQRLAVLFCSYSKESRNSPAFCVNPWVVYMDFYARNDIPLGCFLERYCFRSTYMCPSTTCETPMDKHVRRFVHNSGCVSISLNNFDNEFEEDSIVMWSWCTKCQSVSPVVPMSADTWSYSFAKYLELRFHGDIYSRRGQYPCLHSLHHDHYHYFGYKNYVASFKYTSVNIWEISLPSPIISINYNIDKLHNELIDEVKMSAQKGHEIFSMILDKLSSIFSDDAETMTNFKQLILKDQSHFKQVVEEVQLKLTSPTIENKKFTEKDLHIPHWSILDTLTKIKRLIVETVDSWNVRLMEATRRKETDKKREKSISSEFESSTALEEKLTNISDSESIVENIQDAIECVLEENENNKKLLRTHSDGTLLGFNEEQVDVKKDSDKKTVKTILSQLLPTSSASVIIPVPFSTQEHYNLPLGVNGPIIVYENEPSSIVAYALNSFEYKKSFDEYKKPSVSELTSSPLNKRRGTAEKDTAKDGDDKSSGLLGFLRSKEQNVLTTSTSSNQSGDPPAAVLDKNEDVKKSKNTNIEVQFQDSNCNFFCRIYLAEKFAALRSMVLPIGEEAYIRSLSRSVQWNARGGKSGSNFSKTTDDRFILKEMSKNEVQLFLESASNYFAYMQRCYTAGQPTLLGKIVGIYQIIFKNNSNITLRTNLLVMENLFYNRTVSQKFDLKGSMRNRLVHPENQEGEIVLLDENLLKMTCDNPLYILPHSKSVLIATIQNDTEFLSTQSVMDYSLLVGLDTEKKELVLGIIDYIRTFTWDKKIETMVKKTGILGGQGKLPTIISPEEYQKRFIEAMHKYFLEVPDHWAGLGRGLESIHL
ncbi:unnamed protein product [Brassicogethes aeneus]|uniref:1-phosphatidylinositol-3-phosphate 5-kinase n=1 Tax=Brassicogethes aeneus TaxID=1431903 RepID=A0A9P0ASI8_BRAAE|nr:unnamed protein product [Brassicogethes aeneus]